MTGLFGPEGDGTTAVPEDQRHDLLPTWISTLSELYEAEEENIAAATIGLRPVLADLLDDLYLRRLHRAMLGRVWRWAGRYRLHDTNIGISWPRIPAAVHELLDDTSTWVERDHGRPEEIALRFHHRFEAVHPFTNGNGRFGRIVADRFVVVLGGAKFTWGAAAGLDTETLRSRYLEALRRMDRDPDDIAALLQFARS